MDMQSSDGPWDNLTVSDLTLPGACDELCDGVVAVFHLAAKTHAVSKSPNEEQEYRVLNVDLTRNVVAAAVAVGVRRLVMMSSVKVLGESANESPHSIDGRDQCIRQH